MSLLPQSLFARTATLIAATLAAFAVILWFAITWTIIVPTAPLMANVLEHRVSLAVQAAREHREMPAGVRVIHGEPQSAKLPARYSFVRAYLDHVARELSARLGGTRVLITHVSTPFEVSVQVDPATNAWAQLTWRFTRPSASTAVLSLLALATVLVLLASWWWARKLSTPLSSLAAAADRVALGERVVVDTQSGPREVRSLASAFQSMSQRLHESAEQREFMLAGVSHDLRSPLARLRIAAELIDARDAALAENMTHEIEEMDRMIGLFLHYVRANYNETPRAVIPDEVIRSALPHDQRILLELNAQELRVVPVDAVRQIALNLVQNALDHGRPPVRVSTQCEDGRFIVSVSDAGEGLSEQEWREALIPFNRLRAQPNTGHAGLGLALVDRLARNLGASLTAARTASGFTITVVFDARMSESPIPRE